MKEIILFSFLSIVIGACTLNDEYKQIPGTHGPPYHLHADIWEGDSMKSEPLEALVTMDDHGITAIESWDGSKKTNEKFKTLKVSWDRVGGGGVFTMYDKKYSIQVLDDVDDVYKCIGNYTLPDSSKK